MTTENRNAVIKEALRVHTSNSPPIERVVPAGGLNVNGYFVKEGTVLGIPQHLAHRDRAVFGADAEQFRPERWLEADEAAIKSMDQNFMTVSIQRKSWGDISLTSISLAKAVAAV